MAAADLQVIDGVASPVVRARCFCPSITLCIERPRGSLLVGALVLLVKLVLYALAGFFLLLFAAFAWLLLA